MAECADSTPTKSIERVCVSPSSKEQICLLCAKVVSNNDFRRKLTSSRGPEKQKLVSISSQYWERRFHNQVACVASVSNQVIAQGTHTICLCSRLLFSFYSKCTGFTVCFTYSDVSLTMYINQ